MCNLCMVAGDISIKDEKIFTDLLTIGALRGTDSTGVGAIPLNSKASTRVIKELSPPTALIESKGFDKVMRVNNKVLIGHNRLATKGYISIANAHPYHFVDPDHQDKSLIMGAHNGTLYADYEKALGSNEWGTDSQTIFWSLAVHPDPRETIRKLDGAYALIWFDFRENILYTLRNKERTLYYRFSKSRKTMYVASELEMLFLAMNRNGIAGEERAHLLPEDTLVGYKVPEIGTEFGEPVTREKVEGKKWQQLIQVYPGKTTSSGGKNGTTYGSSSSTKPTPGMMWSYYTGSWVWPFELNKHRNDPTMVFDLKNHPPISQVDDTEDWEDDCPFEMSTETVQEPQREFVDGDWVEVENPMATDIVKAATLMTPGATSTKPAKVTLSSATCTAGSTSAGTPAKLISSISLPEAPKVPTAPPKIDKPLSLVQRHKLVKYDAFVKNNGYAGKCRPVYKDENTSAWWDGSMRVWYIMKWTGASGWEMKPYQFCPEEIPFTMINIESGGDHRFKYEKCRDHKTGQKSRLVLWKGYNSVLLHRRAFDEHMADGCIQCNRHPVWGNPVVFVSPDVFFCEYCAIDSKTMKEYFDLNTNVKQEKIAAR